MGVAHSYCYELLMGYNPQEHMMTSPIQHMATWAGLDSADSASCQKLLLLRGREVETSRADAAQRDGIMWIELLYKQSKMYAYSVGIGSTWKMLSRCQILSYSGQWWSTGVEYCTVKPCCTDTPKNWSCTILRNLTFAMTILQYLFLRFECHLYYHYWQMHLW